MNFFLRKFAFFIVRFYITLKVFLGKEKAIKIMLPFMRFLGSARAPIMAKLLKINRYDDMRELSKIQDMEDKIFGVKGRWEVKEKEHAEKFEMFCPFARVLNNHSEFCHFLVKEFELSTFRRLNKNYSLEIEGKILSEGGPYCRFIHKL
jgi:hypothetical protein